MEKRILLVEDDNDVREVYSEVLKEGGFVVFEVADGLEGTRVALEGKWDLLLLDIMLPGKDGIEILKAVKGNDALKSKPVVLLTNLGNDHIVKECFDAGASSYLIKSEINPDRVIEEVKKQLGLI